MFQLFSKNGLKGSKKRLWSGFAVVGVASLLVSTRIPGVVQGFGNLRKDGVIDVALVVPSLTAEQILAFEIGDLLAPKEKLSAGPVDTSVPGNIFVPEQQENYGFFPITIVKDEFGYYPKRGGETELASYWVSAPFSELVSKIRSHAPYREILPLTTFKRFGLTAQRDWSSAAKITTQLDRRPQSLGTYNWNRKAAASNEVDAVITFQETPNSRWMLGGLDARSQSNGSIQGVEGLNGLSKALFLRITNDAKSNPIGARGYFRNHSTDAPGNFVVDGVPPALEGLKLENKKTLHWVEPNVTGWIGVFRSTQSKRINLFQETDLGVKTNEQWIPASAQEYVLDNALEENEELVVVFVGSDSTEPTRMDDDHEGVEKLSPVLNAATELRLARIR